MEGVHKLVCSSQETSPFILQIRPTQPFSKAFEEQAKSDNPHKITLKLTGNNGAFRVGDETFSLRLAQSKGGFKPECLLFNGSSFRSVGVVKSVGTVAMTNSGNSSKQSRTNQTLAPSRVTRSMAASARTPTTLKINTASKGSRRRRNITAPVVAAATRSTSPGRRSKAPLRKATSQQQDNPNASAASHSSSSSSSSLPGATTRGRDAVHTVAEYEKKKKMFLAMHREYQRLEKEIEADIKLFSDVGKQYREADGQESKERKAAKLRGLYNEKHKEFDRRMMRYDDLNTRLRSLQRALQAFEKQQQQ